MEHDRSKPRSAKSVNDDETSEIVRTLPTPEPTVFDYDPITAHGKMAYLAGQIPKLDGKIAYCGLVGEEVSFDDARKVARICVQQVLAWLNFFAGGLNNVERVPSLGCFVAHADGFTRISDVADAASSRLREVFGEAGRHSRSVIGVRSQPRNSPVLIEFNAALRKPVD